MKYNGSRWRLTQWGVLVVGTLLVGGPAMGQDGRQPTSPICVAVLEPEVLTDLPQAERKALASSLDTLLAESLAKQSGFTLVDRLALDKVLAEKAGKAEGLARIAPGEVVRPLQPFWAAGVLICSQIDVKAGAVIIEAVSAQTGQVLAGIYVKAKVTSAEDIAKTIGPKMESFVRDNRLGIARMRDKPLLEISGRLTSGLSRLAWMADDLAEAAGAKVSAGNEAVLLAPRQPLVTKEERFLRVMGLADAHKDDALAGLSPVPQVRLSFELTDSAKTGVSLEKTPIRLNLSFRRGAEKASKTQIDGEVGQWDTCRDKAVDWLGRQLSALGGNTAARPQDEQQRAKQLAEEELSVVAPWTGLSYHQQQELDLASRRRIARRVLRAAHLDPTSEQAAYLAACYADALDPREGKDTRELSLATIDRAMIEVQRYLDRFPGRDIEHHLAMFSRAGRLGVQGKWKLAGGPAQRDAILRPADVRQYPYASFFVRAWAEEGYLGNVDARYHRGNAFSAFSFALIMDLIPCIPEDKLDEEHEYWRNFYATKVDKILLTHDFKDFLNTRPAPWDLVDAAFQARKKNPQGVRKAFQGLGGEFPPSQTAVWGGDQGTPSRVPMFLKAAGDPDWKTWQPEFTAAEALTIGLDEMTAFIQGLAGKSLPSWQLDLARPVPAIEIVAPEAVKSSGRRSGWSLGDVEALFVAGKDIWLITPASSVGGTRTLSHLFAAEMKPAVNGKIVLDPVEIAWPQDAQAKQLPSDVPIFETRYVAEGAASPTVWIGTQSSGLARFDKASGRWTGRWYTESDGFPSNTIDQISSCRSGTKRLILLVSSTRSVRIMPDGSRKPDRPTYIWTLNPETSEVKLLLDGSQLKDPRMFSPAAMTKDGKLFPLEFLGRGKYDLDVGRIWDFISFGVTSKSSDLVRDENDRFRLLQIMWDAGPDGNFNCLNELSLETFKRLPTSPGRSGGQYSVFPLPETQYVFGRVWWRTGDAVTISGRWPAVYGEFVRGRRRHLWIGFSSADGHRGTSRWLVAYRPAPAGAKDWADQDQWVGPFRVPGQGTITRMAPYGEESLLLTTNQQMYAIDCRQAIEQAIGQGLACSTAQWRVRYEKRLRTSGWKDVLPLLLQSQKWDQVARLLDAEQERLRSTGSGLNTGETHLKLWRAHLQARKGDLTDALQLYDQVAKRAAADRDKPAEVYARMNQIILLFHAERFQEMLDLCQSVNRRFPQTAPERDEERLSWYVKEAKKRIVAAPVR